MLGDEGEEQAGVRCPEPAVKQPRLCRPGGSSFRKRRGYGLEMAPLPLRSVDWQGWQESRGWQAVREIPLPPRDLGSRTQGLGIKPL